MDATTQIGLATLILSLVATGATVWGLRQWKNQKKFDTRFDWAKRFALLAFEFGDILLSAQSPTGFAHEYQDRPKEETETEAEIERNNWRYAHLKRIQPLTSIIQQMKLLNWEASVLFGDDFSEYIEIYREIYKTLYLAIIQQFNPYHETMMRPDRLDRPAYMEKMDKSHEIIFGYGAGLELREKEAENTRKLITELSRYTFNNQSLRRSTSKPQLVATQLEKRNRELEEQLSEARKRLSEIEQEKMASDDDLYLDKSEHQQKHS